MTEKEQPQTEGNKKVVGARGFTKEFKDQIIEVWNSGVYATMAECARNYNVPEKLFYQWIAASQKVRLPVEEAKELAKLRKDNKRLNEELTILKKAAAYFAKEMK
jgi:transposase